MVARTTKLNQTHEAAHKHEAAKPVAPQSAELTPAIDLAALPSVMAAPRLARPVDVLMLQRTAGNRAATRLIQTRQPVRPAVVPQAVQRQAEDEEELQAKSLLQRHAEDEIQTKPVAHRALLGAGYAVDGNHTIRRNWQSRAHTTSPAVRVTSGQSGVIQRHAAYEHYLLGQVDPAELANIPLIRQYKELEDKMKSKGVTKDEAFSSPELKELREQLDKQRDDAKHTLEQEMDRLLIWKDNPEALAGKQTGKVEKGKDDKWQVPYVSLPVKVDDPVDAQPGSDSIVVTYSEINTLPDLFGNPETMANTRKKKVFSLLQGVRQQTYIELDNLYKELFGEYRSELRKVRLGALGREGDFAEATGPRAQAVNAWAYEKRTEMQVNTATEAKKGENKGASEQYFAALERNACHFAPYSWDQWEKYHRSARKLAADSALAKDNAQDMQEMSQQGVGIPEVAIEQEKKDSEKLANQAMLENAFGEHYLQDSFAGGHLIDKTKIMQWFMEWMNSNTGLWQGKMGNTKAAKGQWAMASTMASTNQNLKSNPQALDDTMHKGEKQSVEQAAGSQGLEAKPEVIFMMWWRNAAFVNGKFKKLTPAEAAKECSLDSVKGKPAEAKKLLDALVQQDFAELDTERSGFLWQKKTIVYDLKQVHIDALKKKGGAYTAQVAQKMMVSGQPRDFAKEAQEFNLAAYNLFLSNAYVQGSTKFFHDMYCKAGLEVKTGEGASIGRIYGDANMLHAGAQVGVLYSAETSQWSREAIFNILSGQPMKAKSPEQIRKRFPVEAKDDKGNMIPLVDFNEGLHRLGNEKLFKEAATLGAVIVQKAMGGISGGNALDVGKIAKHDEGVF
jgi:hypothetical protein